LCVRELTRLQLQFAHCAAPIVWLTSSQLLLDIAEPFGRLSALLAGALGVPAPQLVDGVLHVLRYALQIAAFLCACSVVAPLLPAAVLLLIATLLLLPAAFLLPVTSLLALLLL
jgi:hypothetical protein